MRTARLRQFSAGLVVSSLMMTCLSAAAQDEATEKTRIKTMSNSARVVATSEVVKQTTCPTQITVTSMQDLRSWTLPRQQAPFVSARIAERDMGGRKFLTTVCEYRAYRGKLSIERVMGRTSQLRNCRVYTRQNGTGGVQCS